MDVYSKTFKLDRFQKGGGDNACVCVWERGDVREHKPIETDRKDVFERTDFKNENSCVK